MKKTGKAVRFAKLLEQEYSSQKWMGTPQNPMDTLIGTILSQNTSDRNSIPAFKNLKMKFKIWQNVANARESSIASAIRKGGLANIKARRIKRVLAQVQARNGRLSLAPLAKMPRKKAREWLLSLEGVGPKTAAIVLLFGFGMPVFPVDTHVQRVGKRLGLIGKTESYESAHETMDRLVPDTKKQSFHINLIRLGRETCHPRKPECGTCPLRNDCPSAFKTP